MRSSGRRPNRVEPKQVLINQRLDRIPMPQRRYSANGVSGGSADEIGVRLDDSGLEITGNQLFIDAIAPARNDEYRLIGIGALEYQGLGNLLDLAPNCRRSLFGGTSGLRQDDDSGVETFWISTSVGTVGPSREVCRSRQVLQWHLKMVSVVSIRSCGRDEGQGGPGHQDTSTLLHSAFCKTMR